MGRIFNAKCDNGDYTEQFMLGVGMRFGRLENILQMFPEDISERIKIILENNDGNTAQAAQAPLCPIL